ncbi:MAG: O-antigen ligase family protein, partial [Candidatus Colwellbacteria bacterium]|nr:O-antigen ligase family protein [Candidatus Colwellbacteria bacterium]
SLFFPFVTGRVYVFRLLVEISLFFWLILIARKPEFRPRFKNPVILGTLLFLLGLVVTAFLGVDPMHSFFSNIERSDGIVQFGHWVLFLLMIASVMRTPNEWRAFLWVFAGVAFAVAVYAWGLHEARLAGFFNNPSYLAALMLFSIGVAGILWVYTKKEQRKLVGWILGPLILFFLATLIFTQTRGVYLGIIAGFLLFTLLSAIYLRREKQKLVFGAVGVLLLMFLSLGGVFAFKESPLVTGNDILNRVADVSDLANLGAARERYLGWIIALESFKDKPVFGWGPENYDAAFNAHYNYQAAKDESWFDSSHNQLMDVLAEGGMVGFSLYLFWIGAIFYAARKLLTRGTRDKLVGAIIAGTFLGFLVQGWFLFDTFPMYLGLFPLLGFTYFKYERANGEEAMTNAARGKAGKVLPAAWVYALTLVLVLITPYLIYKNVWQPYRANALIFQYQSYLNGGRLSEAAGFLERASRINSPYTNFDVGNQSSWSLLYVLDNPLPEEKKADALALWELVAGQEEKSLDYRPVEPQVYYVLGRLYRHGYGHFGSPEYLKKAETFLRQGTAIAPDRVEYVNELADVLLTQGRREEAENLVKEHAARIGPPYSYKFVGNLYFVLENYELALAEFKKAEAAGLNFWANESEYSRYVFAGQQAGDFGAVLRLSEEYIAKRKPNAEVFFNQAVAYYYLGNKDEARNAYLKAVALNREYEKYAQFFIGQ